MGITATKRMGPAVQRNRIKRVLREVFRCHRHIFPEHCDVVVIPRPGSHTLSYGQVLAEVQSAEPKFSRAGTRKPVGEQL
jgi:ribonuclease P protein component